MSVHLLKDGRWVVHYPRGYNADDPGRTREYFGRGPDAERQAIIRNIELGLGSARIEGGPTFRDLVTKYILARGHDLAKSTLHDLQCKLDGYLLPLLGDLPGPGVTPHVLDDYMQTRARAGQKKTSIHRELTIIRAVLRFAVSRQLLVRNPMEGYQLPKRDDAIISPPTAAELELIYQAAAPHLQRAIRLAYYTGMRPGASELLALRWDHVDLANRTIFVESAKKGGLKARVVPISARLEQLVRRWLEEDKAKGKLGWVVHYHGKRIARISHAWNEAKTRAGITRRIRPYDLRHMAASDMLAGGADLKSVSEILGHSSPDLTLKTYQHTTTAQRRTAVEVLGKCLPIDKENEDGIIDS
jgi:integrase